MHKLLIGITLLFMLITGLRMAIIGAELTPSGLYVMVDYRIYDIVKIFENSDIQIDSN